MMKPYRRSAVLICMALAAGVLASCAPKAPRMVPTIKETAAQWNTAVDRHIPDPERAGRVKQLGVEMIELQDSLSRDIAVLNEQAMALNADYGATREEAKLLLAAFFEKRNVALSQYRDLVFAVRREVSADEWRALTN